MKKTWRKLISVFLICAMMMTPMAGLAESMNVAMAAGIILFEGLRQRKFYREL